LRGWAESFNVRLEEKVFRCFFFLALAQNFVSPNVVFCLKDSLFTRFVSPRRPFLASCGPLAETRTLLSRSFQQKSTSPPSLENAPVAFSSHFAAAWSSSSFPRRPKQKKHHAPARAPVQAPLFRHPAAVAGHRGEIVCVLLMMTRDSVSGCVREREWKNRARWPPVVVAIIPLDSRELRPPVALASESFFSLMAARERLLLPSRSKNLEQRGTVEKDSG